MPPSFVCTFNVHDCFGRRFVFHCVPVPGISAWADLELHQHWKKPLRQQSRFPPKKKYAKQTRHIHTHPCQYVCCCVNMSIYTHLMTQGSVQTLSHTPPPIGVATKPSKKRKVADETPSKAMVMDEPSALDSPNTAKLKLASIAVP